MRNVRVGCLTAMCRKWDVEGNWQLFEQAVRGCKSDQVDVFVSPECFLDGYAATEDDWTLQRFAEVAQEVGDSIYIDRLRQLALEMCANMVFGFTEKSEGRFYNCALIVERSGSIIGRYNKTHLHAHDKRFAAGDDLPVFELDCGVIGVVICSDRCWPETVRSLRLKGAEILMMPAYGSWHLDNEWWMRTRSFENELFLCFSHPSVAFITDPEGKLVAKLQSNRPGILVHDVDLDEAGIFRVSGRRPDLYGILTDPNPVPALRGPKPHNKRD